MGYLKFWLSVLVVLYAFQTSVYATLKFQLEAKRLSTSIVDKILNRYKHAIIESGNSKGEIKLDDIKVTLNLPLFSNFVEIRGIDGRLGNVLTLYRKGPVQEEYIEFPSTMYLRSQIGMDIINIYFESFQVDFPLVNQRATLEVEVRDPVINVAVAIEEFPCRAYLTEMQIVSFGEVIPHVKGMSWGILNSFAERILKRFIKTLYRTSKEKLEEYFYKTGKEAVDFIDICGTLYS